MKPRPTARDVPPWLKFPRTFLAPGWQQASVRPHPGTHTSASGRNPTPRGAVLVDWKRGATFALSLTLAEGMTGRVELPAVEESRGIFPGNESMAVRRVGGHWISNEPVSGNVMLEVR